MYTLRTNIPLKALGGFETWNPLCKNMDQKLFIKVNTVVHPWSHLFPYTRKGQRWDAPWLKLWAVSFNTQHLQVSLINYSSWEHYVFTIVKSGFCTKGCKMLTPTSLCIFKSPSSTANFCNLHQRFHRKKEWKRERRLGFKKKTYQK